jgi:hypothetical protein
MKKSPEPIVLTVALVLLALVAAGLAYTFPDIPTLTGVTSIEPSNPHSPLVMKEEALQAELAPLATPSLWKTPSNNHRLFLSDGYLFYASLYPAGNYLQKDDGTATTPGGVLISWYQKYSLDFTDPNIDREDPDKDGFSNKTEFFNETAPGATTSTGAHATNPLDPKEHPTYLSRLRLEKFDVRQFHIQFVGVVNLSGQNVFQIALQDVPPSGQPPLKHTGDSLGYEGWMVGKYTQKNDVIEDPNTHSKETVDDSTLELDKPDIGASVVLPLRQVINSPEATAYFVMLMPSQIGLETKVGTGKTFTMPMGVPTEYLVISVKDTGAVIRDTKTQQEINVPKLDPAEWNDVPVPPAATTSTTPAN